MGFVEHVVLEQLRDRYSDHCTYEILLMNVGAVGNNMYEAGIQFGQCMETFEYRRAARFVQSGLRRRLSSALKSRMERVGTIGLYLQLYMTIALPSIRAACHDLPSHLLALVSSRIR